MLAIQSNDAAGAAFWLEEPEIELDVCFRENASSPYVTAIRGKVDFVSVDLIAGLLRVEGRDLSARLIDSVLAETFSNRTASEIAEILAVRHGLTPAVAPTKQVIGRYYQGQHDAVSLENFAGRATEWDFLAFIAQIENCDLYVSGDRLNFQPPEQASASNFIFRPRDLIQLTLDRVMTLSGGVEVTVKSWDTHQQIAVVESAFGGGTESSSRNQTRHVLIRPNLSPDSARQLAKRTLAGLLRHERSVELFMPGELELTPRSIITLADTGTAFDQSYRVDSVDRDFSSKGGFVQGVRASTFQPMV